MSGNQKIGSLDSMANFNRAKASGGVDASVSPNRIKVSAGDDGFVGSKGHPFVGVGVDGNVNTFTGFDLGVGIDAGWGKLVAASLGGDSASVYYEHSLQYRRFILDPGNRIGYSYRFPSAELFRLGSLFQLRMPMTVGAAVQFGKADVDHTHSTSRLEETYTPVGMPPQYETIEGPDVTVREKAGYWAILARATLGIDLVPYAHDNNFCLSVHAGPEVGGGMKDGSAKFYLGGALETTFRYAFY